MDGDYITRSDLEKFKQELLTELDARLTGRQPAQRWYKSYQVKKLLSISHGKLQQLRDTGLLPFSRIGNLILYDYQDIERMLKAHRSGRPALLNQSSVSDGL